MIQLRSAIRQTIRSPSCKLRNPSLPPSHFSVCRLPSAYLHPLRCHNRPPCALYCVHATAHSPPRDSTSASWSSAAGHARHLSDSHWPTSGRTRCTPSVSVPLRQSAFADVVDLLGWHFFAEQDVPSHIIPATGATRRIAATGVRWDGRLCICLSSLSGGFIGARDVSERGWFPDSWQRTLGCLS
jgi:hypothetical protein